MEKEEKKLLTARVCGLGAALGQTVLGTSRQDTSHLKLIDWENLVKSGSLPR